MNKSKVAASPYVRGESNEFTPLFYRMQVQLSAWKVFEAIAIAHGLDFWWSPETIQPRFGSGAPDVGAAIGIVFRALETGELKATPVYSSEPAARKPRFDEHTMLHPVEFLRWAESRGWELHPDLRKYLAAVTASENLAAIKSVPGIPIKKATERDAAHQDCRAVAHKLWREDRERSISEVARHSDMRAEGSRKDGRRQFADNTVRVWIADLCPVARRGNPAFRLKSDSPKKHPTSKKAAKSLS
jgi:post-segregation antitoxin (ccd killing protein)